jgi:hypothetical protein
MFRDPRVILSKMVTLTVTPDKLRGESSSSVSARRLNCQRKLWSWREELNHPTVAGSAQTLASSAPAEGASPLARSPRRGHIPFETPRLEVQEQDSLVVCFRRPNSIKR